MTPDATPIPMNSNVITLEGHGECHDGLCQPQLYFRDTPNKAKEILRITEDGKIICNPDLTLDDLIAAIESLKKRVKP